MPVALITGASRGFGRALARELHARGFGLIIDARNEAALAQAARELPGTLAVHGDVADAAHREELTRAARSLGRLDLLVNNAGGLGPSPLPPLDKYPLSDLEDLLRVNVLAPLALLQRVLPMLRTSGGVVVNVTSDAAVEAYAGWGGYGATKAALDQLTRVLAAEEPSVRFYAFDPGDMRTDMHQRAYPGEDISDRPLPEDAVPALIRLWERRPPGGRYLKSDLLVEAGSAP